MRILFTRFPLESAHGGAEIQTISLMRGLNDRGHDVSFLGSCPAMLELCQENNIDFEELNIGKPPVTKWHALTFIRKQFRMKKKLIKAIELHEKPDAIVMISLSEKLLLTHPAHEMGIKVFWLEHDRIGRWLTMNPWLHRLRKLSTEATTIGVSELSRQIYLSLGFPEKRVKAIANGIDLDRFKVESSKLKVKPSTSNLKPTTRNLLRIGCVSRLSPEKGVDVLVDAVRDLPDTSLEIIGTGPQKLELPSNAKIIDRVEDLGSFYQSIDVLVLPSREHDPFGLVAAEAMTLGTPVIVTDACGIADYLASGNDSLVVKANSSKALKGAILKLFDDDLRKSIGFTGNKTATKKFAFEKMIKAYECILNT